MMLMLKKAGRINQIRAANRIEYLRDRDAGGKKARGIGHHLKFWNAAALNDYRGDAVQPVDARFHIIRRDFPESVRRNGVRSQAIANDGEHGKGEAMCFHLRGGWKLGLQASHNRIDSLQGQNHVGIPIEEKIDFGGAAAGDGLNLQQTRHTVDGFFDRAGDHHQHLVDGHDAVVHANDDAGEIRVWKNGDGDRQCQISAHQGQADDQKQNRAR